REMWPSADGKHLVTAGDDEVRVWELATGRLVRDIGGDQKIFTHRLALSADSKLLATTHRNKDSRVGVVRIWETAKGKLVLENAETERVGSIAFSPDGKALALSSIGVMGRSRLIRLIEVATGDEIKKLVRQAAPLDSLAFSPDGKTLIWGGPSFRELNVW